jgi:hypothetical protein
VLVSRIFECRSSRKCANLGKGKDHQDGEKANHGGLDFAGRVACHEEQALCGIPRIASGLTARSSSTKARFWCVSLDSQDDKLFQAYAAARKRERSPKMKSGSGTRWRATITTPSLDVAREATMTDSANEAVGQTTRLAWDVAAGRFRACALLCHHPSLVPLMPG